MENRKLRIENELKPYDEYKETGLLWLDKVPKHWEVVRVKSEFITVKKPSYEENPTVLSLTQNGIKVRDVSKNEGQLAESYDGYNTVGIGDICLNPMDLESGAAAISNYYGVISNAYYTIRPRDKDRVNTRFYGKYFNMHYKQKVFYPHGKGVGRPEGSGGRWTLNRDTFMKFPLLIPPKEEQDQIVRYLDSKISKINKFIKAKKKQIELLKELKQAIINQAVTKGLDPNAKMKSSGIEWLGDIPEGWEVVKIKQLFNIINGATPKSSVEKYWDGSVTWITPVDLSKTDVYVQSSERKITEEGFNSCSTKIIPKNNIVLATRAPIGNVRINDIDLCTNQGCKGLILKTADYIKYIFYSLRNYEKQLKRLGDGTTFAELSNTKLSIFKIPLPPLQEQQQIVNYIETKTQTIDKTIEAIKKEISLITEYRTSLISNVVTGKVDVRHIGVEDAIQGLEEDLEDLEEENIDEEIEMGEEE